MKKTLLFVAVVAYCCYGYSQTFVLNGKVVDELNETIGFANVLLLNASDSTFIKGTSASELGVFRFDDIEPNKYLIQASYIGNTSAFVPIAVNGNTEVPALTIDFSAQELDEVVVSTNRPKIERLQDRLVFNVENTVVSQGDSWQVLKNTPGVIVSGNDLEIRGASATVYLNNRKVQLSGEELKTLLEGFSGANIKSVEVIANPPANYDAEGGPVLNITTSKAITPGYKGSLNGSFTQAIFPKYNLGTTHFFKAEKLDVFLNYGVSPRKELEKTNKGINFIDGNSALFSAWETDVEEIKRNVAHNATAILDYNFDTNNSLNFTSTFFSNPNLERNRTSATRIENGLGAIDSTFATTNELEESNTNFAVDLTYSHNFKKSGSKLTINGHFTNFDRNFNQAIASDYFDPTGNFIRNFAFETVSDQDINIYTGQVDYVYPFGTGSFETGAKASVINSASSIDYLNFQGSDESVDASLSDDFLYDETVYAGYLSIVQNWEKWSLKAGLRGEYTDAVGNSLTLGLVNNQEFFELFPSIYILHTISDKHSLAFDYRRGLQRPKYNDLNPFRVFSNENDFIEGNATLVPNFSNNFNLNYSYNSELFFDFYYRDNGRYINTLVFQNNENQTLNTLKQNVLGSNSYGLDITYSKSLLNPWYVYAYVSFFHEDETLLAVQSNNQEFKNVVNGVYAYWGNYLTLSKDGTFTGEMAMTYISKFLFGSYVQSEQLNVTVGLRKSLWNKRAVVSLAAEDLLGRYDFLYSSKYFNQDNYYRLTPETLFVRLGFTYNFGNFRLSDNERGLTKKERERLQN